MIPKLLLLLTLTFVSFNADASLWGKIKSAWKSGVQKAKDNIPNRNKDETPTTKPNNGNNPQPSKPPVICNDDNTEVEPTLDPGDIVIGVGDPPKKDCSDVVLPDTKPPVKKNTQCLSFDKNLFSQSNSGATLSSLIQNSKDKRSAFKKHYGPLAVYLQSKTGYPASAIMSQWSEETNWGTSKQAVVNNNLGGHSCWDKRTGYKYPSGNLPEYMKPEKIVDCTYKRPRRERGMYITFRNSLDAGLSQIYNIIDNPKTAGVYSETRGVLKKALSQGKKPNPFEILDGLEAYAAFPPEYIETLKNRIKEDNLEVFDNFGVCDE